VKGGGGTRLFGGKNIRAMEQEKAERTVQLIALTMGKKASSLSKSSRTLERDQVVQKNEIWGHINSVGEEWDY